MTCGENRQRGHSTEPCSFSRRANGPRSHSEPANQIQKNKCNHESTKTRTKLKQKLRRRRSKSSSPADPKRHVSIQGGRNSRRNSCQPANPLDTKTVAPYPPPPSRKNKGNRENVFFFVLSCFRGPGAVLAVVLWLTPSPRTQQRHLITLSPSNSTTTTVAIGSKIGRSRLRRVRPRSVFVSTGALSARR